jgi:metal-responsive CopG/Arc/MetJ family transcriptional regulator
VTQITATLDDDLIMNLDKIAGERNLSRSRLILDILKKYISDSASTTSEPASPSSDILKELEMRDRIIAAKDETIRKLDDDIGFLRLEYQKMSSINDRLLMPGQEEIVKKNWWQFWK